MVKCRKRKQISNRGKQESETLWLYGKITEFTLNQQRGRIIKTVCAFCIIVINSFIYHTLKCTPDETFLKRTTFIIPQLFQQPSLGVMLLFLANTYTSTYFIVKRLKTTVFKHLMDPNKFPLLENRMDAKKSERLCYMTTAVLSVSVTISHCIFHPIWGFGNNSPYKYLINPRDSNVLFGLLEFFLMICMTYSLMVAVMASFYIFWNTHILHFRISDYIKTHLCKKYHNFNVIYCKTEQDIIHQHLIRFVKYHSRLKKLLNETQKAQNSLILMLCSQGIIAFIAGLFYIFAGLNPEDNFKVLIVMFTFTLIFLAFCFNGQQVTDAFEKIHDDMCSTSWIYWNIRNRKLLLIVLPNTAKKVETTLAGLIAMNYPMILTAAKVSYSLLTVVLKLKN